MKIALLGTGTVGRMLGAALAGQGHEVTLGTRDPAGTLARVGADAMESPPISEWFTAHPGIGLARFARAAEATELVVNATNGAASLTVPARTGAGNLAGKVLLDIANPLDFSHGMPPSLTVCNRDSLGEQIHRAYPAAKVVKSLNTMSAALMMNPGLVAGGEHSVFVSGNDAEAKKTVTALLTDLGHTDVIDLGDITTARTSEMLLPIWLRLWGALGTPLLNFKIVR
ncbi:NADP oxidoreductase [Cryobacterium sp. TMT1-21]|uniref:NADPH-dependent F420 reductase n=1 Tax=unclassified Cryobacterium TaxID=2649013 RepID=UPI00106BBD63|nr:MULTISPECIES: NAD(P)-binding domain-containing protein [unclassified Cryobacterium]TFC86211.1 NADP oxidoreductase [Cryobacterium sp. TmT2-59]TFD12653.1 NADP oxidoreductase [Cryobacterium sp. TMT1-21]TFD20793.1 NADP oxidoreductase [Cryobacterium sp. TMT2-23]